MELTPVMVNGGAFTWNVFGFACSTWAPVEGEAPTDSLSFKVWWKKKKVNDAATAIAAIIDTPMMMRFLMVFFAVFISLGSFHCDGVGGGAKFSVGSSKFFPLCLNAGNGAAVFVIKTSPPWNCWDAPLELVCSSDVGYPSQPFSQFCDAQ